ncbi:hypothetical protein C8J56DRAFT_916244 [Mycena floridula]|nr:hypothetical protein C8J56DRAFT_916244 [Mycena floridula]
MEAVFNNKNNVLNAEICALHDNSVMYSLQTTFGWGGRKITILRDTNPGTGGTSNSHIVGAIHWQDKTMEVNGQRKKFSDIKRHEGNVFRKTRHWKWAPDRKEYAVVYHEDEWKASLNNNMMIAGRFCVPFRPHLFSKPKPTVLHLTPSALAEDEVFLILIFVYSEAKRQDDTNSSVGAGSEGW